MLNSIKSNQTYYQSEFSNLSYNEKVFEKIEFEQCSFKKSSFVTCTFLNCKFINCKFSDCLLSTIKPTNSSFFEIEFSKSKVMGFDWIIAHRVDALSFEECDISYSNFHLLRLPKIKIVNSVCKEVDFAEADLHEGNFQGTNFMRAVFSKTNLEKCNFSHATSYYIDVKMNKVSKASFTYPEALSLLQPFDIKVDY